MKNISQEIKNDLQKQVQKLKETIAHFGKYKHSESEGMRRIYDRGIEIAENKMKEIEKMIKLGKS